jgi:hypothetical protein
MVHEHGAGQRCFNVDTEMIQRINHSQCFTLGNSIPALNVAQGTRSVGNRMLYTIIADLTQDAPNRPIGRIGMKPERLRPVWHMENGAADECGLQ